MTGRDLLLYGLFLSQRKSNGKIVRSANQESTQMQVLWRAQTVQPGNTREMLDRQHAGLVTPDYVRLQRLCTQ